MHLFVFGPQFKPQVRHRELQLSVAPVDLHQLLLQLSDRTNGT